MLGLRDNKRYGVFKANSSVGEIKIDISISGFGEQMRVIKDGKVIAFEDTSDNFDDDHEYETDNKIIVDQIEVYKPFIRCLKRYK